MFSEVGIVRTFIHGDVWLLSADNMLPHALVINKVKTEPNTSVKIFIMVYILSFFTVLLHDVAGVVGDLECSNW